jgi:hypothetical protein
VKFPGVLGWDLAGAAVGPGVEVACFCLVCLHAVHQRRLRVRIHSGVVPQPFAAFLRLETIPGLLPDSEMARRGDHARRSTLWFRHLDAWRWVRNLRVPWHNVVADMLVRGSRVGPITDRERTSVTGAAFWVWLTICVSG